MKYIAIDPDIKGGTPVLKGTRFSVSRLLMEMAMGNSPQGVADEYDIDLRTIEGFFEELSVSIAGLLEGDRGK